MGPNPGTRIREELGVVYVTYSTLYEIKYLFIGKALTNYSYMLTMCKGSRNSRCMQRVVVSQSALDRESASEIRRVNM